MKKGLIGSTALIGAATLLSGTAGAAEAPTWKLTGNANFQLYWVDQDWSMINSKASWAPPTSNTANADIIQDHGWYFGVDEAELQINVSGTADNGLNYGFKIEINANTTDGTVADEARLQLSGSWGTLQMGDEDGAEDIMNYGGESLMGATGGFDGDYDDVLNRIWQTSDNGWVTGSGDEVFFPEGIVHGGPSYPTIAGDTSDATKISYFSPRFSGFQVGASITPTPNNGDSFKADGGWENHIGIGANYDNSFGDLRIRASVVYSGATVNDDQANTTSGGDPWKHEDISAWSVGGIVGWGPFSLGANYTDNGESGQANFWDDSAGAFVSTGVESSYWNVAASFETGPMYFSAGYMVSTVDWGEYASATILNNQMNWLNGAGAGDEGTFSVISLTADYTMAPGLGVYAEIDMIDDDHGFETGIFDASDENSATILIVGANISF